MFTTLGIDVIKIVTQLSVIYTKFISSYYWNRLKINGLWNNKLENFENPFCNNLPPKYKDIFGCKDERNIISSLGKNSKPINDERNVQNLLNECIFSI